MFRYGLPISAADYKEQFLSSEENAPRAAVKLVTKQVEAELVEATVNAPDWYVFEYVAPLSSNMEL